MRASWPLCWRRPAQYKPFSAARLSPPAPTGAPPPRRQAARAAAAAAAASQHPEGRLLPARLGPARLQLMVQRFEVAGRQLQVITPADVDAVLDMYIAGGV